MSKSEHILYSESRSSAIFAFTSRHKEEEEKLMHSTDMKCNGNLFQMKVCLRRFEPQSRVCHSLEIGSMKKRKRETAAAQNEKNCNMGVDVESKKKRETRLLLLLRRFFLFYFSLFLSCPRYFFFLLTKDNQIDFVLTSFFLLVCMLVHVVIMN